MRSGVVADMAHPYAERGLSGAHTTIFPMSWSMVTSSRSPLDWYPSSLDMSMSGVMCDDLSGCCGVISGAKVVKKCGNVDVSWKKCATLTLSKLGFTSTIKAKKLRILLCIVFGLHFFDFVEIRLHLNNKSKKLRFSLCIVFGLH